MGFCLTVCLCVFFCLSMAFLLFFHSCLIKLALSPHYQVILKRILMGRIIFVFQNVCYDQSQHWFRIQCKNHSVTTCVSNSSQLPGKMKTHTLILHLFPSYDGNYCSSYLNTPVVNQTIAVSCSVVTHLCLPT